MQAQNGCIIPAFQRNIYGNRRSHIYPPSVRELSSYLKWAVLSVVILSCACLPAHGQVPTVVGQVTSAITPNDFEVNGEHVICDQDTRFTTMHPADANRISWSEKPYLGAPLVIYGHSDRHTHIIRAKRVIFSPADVVLRGKAVIDRMLAPQPNGALLVRADGYPILLTISTKLTFVSPLASFADVRTNQWISYRGKQRPDGVVVAEEATLSPNQINEREANLRSKDNYDPASVPSDAHQSAMRIVTGAIDPNQLPPTHDLAAQARVENIGRKLIPEYQRALPDSDPTKIPFRFQVFEEKHLNRSVDFADGTILIPLSTVKHLQNDDQIASYLAANMAAVIEKQEFRDAHKKTVFSAASLGSYFLPVAPVAYVIAMPALVAAGASLDALELAEAQQDIRVALCLMHDTGYDVSEAPKTWWLLSSKEPQPLSKIEIPSPSVYTYAILGSTWRDTSWE